jgi:hypothetical protein
MSVLTEVEALHKWCPFAQVAVSASDDVVANTLSGKAVTCAASSCMAWRWADPEFEFEETDNLIIDEADGRQKPRGTPPKPEGDGWEVADDTTFKGRVMYGGNGEFGNGDSTKWKRPYANRRGYCGMAGTPE